MFEKLLNMQQVDLEMAWTDGEGVMRRVEKLIKSLYQKFAKPGTPLASPLPDIPFLRMSYDEAMSKHGSDKPDLRIKGLVGYVPCFLLATANRSRSIKLMILLRTN
jgi:aspartyl-tRNA synthetase